MLVSVLVAAGAILVAPFAVKEEAQPWAGVAAAESLLDVVVQANKDNFLTMKQLDAVLRRRDLKLNDAAVAATAPELARALGATDLISGEVSVHGAQAALSAKRINVAEGTVKVESRAPGARKDLAQLAQSRARELRGASDRPPPLTQSEKALEEASRCEIVLARQSLGAHSRVTISSERLKEAEKECKAALAADQLARQRLRKLRQV